MLRRNVLKSLIGSSPLFSGIVSQLLAASEDPLAPKGTHFPARAKRVIFLFSTGGVSHMDTFDPKPALFAADGKTMGVGGGLSNQQRALQRPLWKYQPGGTCGTQVSDLFPHIREQMDDICLIRSMQSNDNEHYQATLAIHTGSFFFSRPSIGSWLSYGLGTMNSNLPSFIVLAPQLPYAGTLVYANDFLPAYHQGVRVVPGATPIPNLDRRTPQQRVQELELQLAERLNEQHRERHPGQGELAARMRTFETAFHMQSEARDVFDLSRESEETLGLYGLQRGQTDGFGWQCLVARRLAERGVRFIELVDGGSSGNWDSHGDMADHGPRAKAIDRPIAGLLQDLKRLGMLDDTLVVWTTEFGRTPGADGAKGRGHHSACFSSWLAGGGVKGGMAYGQTDELAATVAENPVHVHDFHATILHLLGIDHTRLTYRHGGRDYRLTDVHGKVVQELLA
ncbi:DUF1501 domain-containing protein [Planctomyces sp. SH-PL14]|uniref:DUF1501 domain-containing protein n=1 Tax=Planctomyces sp. SH-PL14 TaxID=1632864 RepID=UPI00078BC1D6|nr:DUF1501 domain-containing protein [Planctomyces sp. SH-PL14]AMV17789.1 hypothetical protein VT03_07845 [Planctomyces sp. SH-PL14]